MGKGFIGTFATVSEWFYFLLVLQLFWLMGLILGGIILGIFPATYACFAVVRKRLQKGDVRINKEFWKVYQAYFLTSQFEGWIWILIGMFIYYDIRILFAYQNIFSFIVGSIFVSILMIYGMITMLILPIHSRYELTVLNRIRLALIIAITFPHISVGLTVGTMIIYFITTKLPIFFMFIGVSSIALLYTYVSIFAFQKVEKTGYIRNIQVS